jgi:hypothetical protein
VRRLIATCSVALLAIALFGACGGSSSKAGSSNPSDTKGSSDNNSSSSSDSDYAKLVADASKERFKITYTTGSGGDEQTYAQDGKGNSVYGSGDTQYFVSPDGSVSCSTDSDGKASCTKVSGTGTSISPFLSLFQSGKAAIAALGGRYGDVSSKTIAGRDAKCLSISIAASATYCIDKDTGVLLELSAKSSSGKQEASFLVTKFEEPSDSDFTPPATPETIPSVSIPTITYPPGYNGPTVPQ